MECGEAFVVFDGIDSPVTQTFGLGVCEELSAATLDTIERFFFDRGAPAQHEVSPLAGTAALDLLCARGYQPSEITNVLYRSVEEPATADPPNIRVRMIGPEDGPLWAQVSARGWTNEHPEFRETIQQLGAVAAARNGSACFLAELNGQPGAAGALSIHDGVALFGGSATIPAMRRRGLQAALLEARMRFAFEHGCDLAMMVAEAASNSQRNAERQGFRIAYTRFKWRLAKP
jgi:GNAT superfamily N-acetyltransferase